MMKEIVELLIQRKETISTMESCTGGMVANEITNIPGASEIFQLGIVSYSNHMKEKYGMDPSIIEKYTVYSMEVAREMARLANVNGESDYGVGITGTLNRQDPNNPTDKMNMVYFAIYDKKEDTYIEQTMSVSSFDRVENKKMIMRLLVMRLRTLLEGK